MLLYRLIWPPHPRQVALALTVRNLNNSPLVPSCLLREGIPARVKNIYQAPGGGSRGKVGVGWGTPKPQHGPVTEHQT